METPKPVVLLVEDDPNIGTLVSLRLATHYRVIVATNDRTACAHLRTVGRQLHAVLMDIQLIGSKLDGLALIRLIRGTLPAEQTPDYAKDIAPLRLPVYIVSASADFGSDELKEIGADGAMPKPIDFRFLSLCLAQASIRHVVNGLGPALQPTQIKKQA